MKKHIKRKIENSKTQSAIDPADQCSHEISPDRNKNSPPGQSPLPRGSPPDSDNPSTSDNPSAFGNPTTSGNSSTSENLFTSGNSAVSRSPKTTKRNSSEKEHHDDAKFPKPSVCRDYIRGTCKRLDCKYAHEFDLSQLKGVYTFCHNYQNAVCTYPNCKFVHATVFEQAEFYRTGMLPSHAIAHHKTKNTAKLLPPPPPPPPPQSPPFLYYNTEFRHANRNPAIHALQSSYVPLDAVAGPSGLQLLMAYDNGSTVESDTYVETRPANRDPAIHALQSSFVPHEGVAGPSGMQLLMANDNGPTVEQDLCCAASGSPCASAKQKCSNCGVYENRLQHSNQKVEALKSSIQEIDRKTEELDAEERRMNYVISVLMALAKDRQRMQNKNNFGPGPSNNGM